MIDGKTRRTVLTAVVAVLVVSLTSIAGVGLAAAQPSEKGGDAGGDAAASGGGLPSLPDAASGVAKDVLGTVGEFLSGGLEGLGEALRGVTPGGEGGE